METIVVSDTVQKFNGVSYYKCGNYFQKKGARLHRAVWEYHNGAIPKGYHVHHKDHNRANNNIDNLELLEGSVHLSKHMGEADRKEQARGSIKKAIECAREWHGTEDGFKWHSKHAKEYWKNAKENTYTCTYCGKEFKTKYVYSKKSNHFCHNNCKAAYRRMLIRNGVLEK